MSRKTLLVLLAVAVVTTCACVAWLSRPAPDFATTTAPAQAPGTVAEVRGAPAPSLEASAACAGTCPPLIEPVEISAASAPAGPPPVEVLRTWDAQRAEAWARGDPGLLTTLYTRGSVAGRRDRAMLRAWLARGLVVREMQTQLLEVREVRRTASIWALIVTDRLVGGLAVGTSLRWPLPHDAPTTRTVELRRVNGRWLVSAVEPLGPGP